MCKFPILWNMTAVVGDEQSVDKLNEILSEIHRGYISQRRLLVWILFQISVTICYM